MRQHTQAQIWEFLPAGQWGGVPSIRQVHVSIRQLTSAYVSMRQLTSAYVRIRRRIPAGGCQRVSGEVSLRSIEVGVRPPLLRVTAQVVGRHEHVRALRNHEPADLCLLLCLAPEDVCGGV